MTGIRGKNGGICLLRRLGTPGRAIRYELVIVA